MAETPERFFYADGGIHLQPYAETITWLLLRGMSSGGIDGKGRKGKGRKREGGREEEGEREYSAIKSPSAIKGGYKAGRGGREGENKGGHKGKQGATRGKQGESTIARR